ncbi:hypothetical protein MMC31_007804, partial [Peltigera leucophlebia]|nr:hypothetical protein [Peltigera leucophlebia]
LEDNRHDDEPAEASSPEPQHFPPVYQSRLEFDDDEPKEEPLVAESPEPQRLFPIRPGSPVPENDDDEGGDESVEGESHAPRRLFPVHQFHSTVFDPPQPAP